jgi:hypothetical protein
MPYSPSLLSRTSNTTQAAVKKAAKSVKKAVKKGAVAVSRPFKKRRKSSTESIQVEEESCKYFFFRWFKVLLMSILQ